MCRDETELQAPWCGSTGPKTAEGKARIAEAQRKRWARWRTDEGERLSWRQDDLNPQGSPAAYVLSWHEGRMSISDICL
jgi:ferric-dicitrate binding protein FerR (iron transport regulator)